MRKYIIFIVLILLISSKSNASEMTRFSFICKDLSFTINPSVQTIEFSNIHLFSVAEMIAGIPMGYTTQNLKAVNTQYNWHNTTIITIDFDKEIRRYFDGEMAEIEFSFDDNDGIYLEAKKLACKTGVNNI
ncbi:hypothetical protein [Desulfosediminicola sp.]|uniref:hypothetical protein n=1 Tax=Desulfosediminicola sp. TaxID=2886825 RepID=UPI003AF24788